MRASRPHSTILLLAMVVCGGPGAAMADDPAPARGPASASDGPPIPIFLNAPTDLAGFWKMLARPDFVILDGEQYRKLQRGGPTANPADAGATPPAPIESVEVSGEVVGDWARLSIVLKVAAVGDGPTWAPVRLDGLNLSRVRLGPRDLPARVGRDKSWEVELPGRGEHSVEVGLLAPVRATAEGHRLDLPIPLAASTRVDLKFPTQVADASTGLNEPAVVGPEEGGPGTRVAARLSPRPRIELAWRERADPSSTLPTLLSAQGEIAMEVERGAIRTRSSWVVGAIRGSDSRLAIGLDAGEEVLDVEVDDRPVLFDVKPNSGRSVLTVPLAEPLRANASRSLVISTRRPIASGGSTRVAIKGYTFDHAKVQTGVLAIVRSGPIFLNPSPGRGLRRIDPRTELPEGLRARPDTALAFEFNDQPFELNLGVEPAPPRLLVEGRSTITLDPRSARVDTRLNCRASQGRTFEMAVLVPEDLVFEGAGPPEVVSSAQVVPLRPKQGEGEGPGVARVLTITLTLQAREAESFTVHLKGRSAIDASRPVAVPLFQPMVDSTTGSRFALVSDRNVSAEPIEGGDVPSPFRVDSEAPPSDWAWPARRPGPEFGLLWLRSDSKPEALPLKLTIRPRTIRHESTTTATFGRGWVDVVEEVSGEVAFGSVSRLDIALSPEVPARWDVENVDLAGREPLGQDPDGSRRYRLKFAREYSEAFRLRVRYRLPYPEPLAIGRDARVRLAPLRVLEGSTIGQDVRASAEAGIDLSSESTGWSPSPSIDPVFGPDPGPTIRLSLHRPDDKPGPVTVLARLGPRVALPGLVVSRLWLRTVQRLEGDLATTASFWVETREGPMTLGLPTGARWVRSRIGGRPTAEDLVEGAGPDEYRVRFPASTPSGPVLVEVDYEVPAARAVDGWQAPRLLGGGVIQQSAWEVRLIGGRAGIGTPPGWVEENEWYWGGLLWRRRPWKGPGEMASWIGGNPRPSPGDPPDADDPAGRHAYLFSRSGPPTSLKFAVFSRFTLVLLCSGPVLLAGLLVLARRPPPRVVGGVALASAFAVVALADLSTTIPVAQSAAPGVLLWLGALAIHWSLERRDRGRGAVGPVVEGVAPGSECSIESHPGVGSDDSTAIRPRPATGSAISTADHIVLTRPVARSTDQGSTTGPGEAR